VTVVNGSLLFGSEDTSYYYYSLRQSVCQSVICFSRTLLFSIDCLTNSNYPRFQPNNFMVGMIFNNTLVAPSQALSITPLKASQAILAASRSVTEAFAVANITINLSIMEAISSSTTIFISTNLSIFYGGISNAWVVGTTANTAVSYINHINSSYLSNVSLSIPQLQQNTTLVIQVTNSPLSPINGSNFNISIYNSSLLFYSNSFVPISN
jgi:hypothetical protein